MIASDRENLARTAYAAVRAGRPALSLLQALGRACGMGAADALQWSREYAARQRKG